MAPKEKQKIEIEKSHRDPLLSFNQAVTVDCSDFLGTALTKSILYSAAVMETPGWHVAGASCRRNLGQKMDPSRRMAHYARCQSRS
jgi:hypothetical protein